MSVRANSESRTLAAVITERAERQADRIALTDGEGTEVTYGEAFERGQRISAGLSALGIEAEQTALLMLDNSLDYCLTLIGMHLYRQIEVPVNTAYKGGVLVHTINDSGASAILIEARYLDRLAEIADETPNLRTAIVRGEVPAEHGLDPRIELVAFDSLSEHDPEPLPRVAERDILAILYTSGTTGRSKGVLVPNAHGWGCYQPRFWSGEQLAETVLVTQPLFHLSGQWAGMAYAFHGGGTAVIRPGFHASTFWEEVRDNGCTQTLLLGAVANFLHRQPERENDADNPLARAIMIPVIPEVDEFAKRFGVSIGSAYGLTEGSAPVVAPYGEARPQSCGRVRAGFEVRVVDERGYEVPDGEVGEMTIRADEPWMTMAGYHNNPQATVEAWRDLRLHTGDAMLRNPDGTFRFVDRRKDALRRRGENVSSFEVEAEINAHDAVVESAVFGVPSEHTEDEIMAAVVLKPDRETTPEQLLEHLVKRLPYFMVPRYLEFVDELPKTPTQKIRKAALRERGVTEGTWDRVAAGIEVTRDS